MQELKLKNRIIGDKHPTYIIAEMSANHAGSIERAFMRCLAIAKALRTRAEEVMFIIADNQAEYILKQHNFKYIILHTKWDDLESELIPIKEIIKKYDVNNLLIDSYKVTYKYLEFLGKLTKTYYIDDIGKFDYPVDGIICYANYWSELCYRLDDARVSYYLDTSYVPLQQEFWDMPHKVISNKVKNLLIMTGGSDPYNITSRILDKIDTKDYEEIDVICGRYNKNYNDLAIKYKTEKNVSILKDVNNIYEFMKKTDVAISAGGTTLYELCACGTPTISYSFVDNQINNVKQFENDGLIQYVGDIRDDNLTERMNSILKNLCDNIDEREQRSKRMQSAVDGYGAMRIANILSEHI